LLAKLAARVYCIPCCCEQAQARKSAGVAIPITTLIVGVLVVSLSVLLALAGLFVARRLVSATYLESSNGVAGSIYMPLSGLFGILIAFSAFLVWEQNNSAHVTAEREAGLLAAIYWHAEGLPESERQQVQELANSYALVVKEEEWSLMEEGQESSQAWAIVDELRRSIDLFEPSTSSEQTLQARLVTLYDDLVEDRTLRLLHSREGLPPPLWETLLIGTPMIVAFTYLFGVKNFRVHMVMVAMLTAIIVTVLCSIKAIEYPFTGDVRVPPDAFELVLNRFEADRNS
jgi:Protein of unknown function (DUF4239)